MPQVQSSILENRLIYRRRALWLLDPQDFSPSDSRPKSVKKSRVKLNNLYDPVAHVRFAFMRPLTDPAHAGRSKSLSSSKFQCYLFQERVL